MRRRLLTLLLVSMPMGLAAPALAAQRCVGPGPQCFHGLQQAVDASGDGDTIVVRPGTYPGGVTITKSVDIVGSGQRSTVLRGGNPVLTIGEFGAEPEPSVSLRDLAITHGRSDSSPESMPFTDSEGILARGGGITVPPGGPITDQSLEAGASVKLVRVTVSDNRAAPSATAPFGPPCPGGDPCPFAQAAGGGVATWGPLTVIDSTFTDNVAGSPGGRASDSDGGAIFSLLSPLTILRSRFDGNRSIATGPVARFAEGGGIFAAGSEVTMRDSVVTDSTTLLASELPSDVEQLAVGGGAHITGDVVTSRFDRDAFAGNSVRATNSTGDAIAFSGGLHIDSPGDFAMTRGVLAGNRASAATTGGGLAHADSGGGQLYGTLRNTLVSGNRVDADSDGDAEAFAGGMWVLFGDVGSSAFLGNRLRADGEASATVRAGGALVDAADTGLSGLTLDRSLVAGNIGAARGGVTLGQGGGVFDAFVGEDGPFGGPLALVDSAVTGNVLRAGVRQGGGVYLSGQPITRTRSLIAGNVPDQCFGCGAALARAARAGGAARSRSGDPMAAHIVSGDG
jgi:hypothetical protein